MTNQHDDQQQTTQVTEQSYNREEEYVQAQRSAVEALTVGRETLETSVAQGEQLKNAEDAAEETEYKLDRATRLLRGMTWSGWLANKFTRDIHPPEYRSSDASQQSSANHRGSSLAPAAYDNVPPMCDEAAQAIQNYNANLSVLEACETHEQRETCKVICDNMFEVASKQLKSLRNDLQRMEPGNVAASNASSSSSSSSNTVMVVVDRLSSDLSALRNRQIDLQNLKRPDGQNSLDAAKTSSTSSSQLFKQTSSSQQQQRNSAALHSNPIMQQQENHLEFMSHHLGELNSIAQNLNQSLADQNTTLESLDDKSESVLFKTRMVTRRADRIIQKNTWSRAKPEFVSNVSIRHAATGKYLAVTPSNGLTLSDKFNETCVFGYWKRKGGIFGLQSRYSRKWAGQSMLGNLSCNANYFGRREEWDSEGEWSSTPLLCASAGWGNGGYLLATAERDAIAIGGGGLKDKQNADLWCIAEKDM